MSRCDGIRKTSLSLGFFNLGLNELRSIELLRSEAIVAMTQDPQEPLIVTSKDREGSFMLDLEPGPRGAPPSVWTPVLAALVPRSLVHPLLNR